MDPPQAERDDLISQFCAITGAAPSEASEYLAVNHWNPRDALSLYYARQEDSESDDEPAQPSAGHTLGGAAPPLSSSSGPAKAPRKKFATLGDLTSGDHQHGDSDSDEQDMYAGGGKSGLAVQNPDDLKKKIIQRAQDGVPRPGGDDPTPRSSYFTGSARTLGGDDAPSQIVHAPPTNVPRRPERVTRTLHFWTDGFSVDEGDLYRNDDPVNAPILEGIRQGRAPLSIMNVHPGQEVDVEVKQHNEKYVRPKAKYKPFSGAGHRLGSPTPGAGTNSPSPAPAPAVAVTPQSSGPATPAIDESQPTVAFQIRLGDGTRLTTRFNATNTIGDVYSFVAAASPASQTRPWVLMTTFPSTELSDKNAVIGDLKEYSRGGVVVQKWT
ncbi:hypothetical protein FQN55_008733 [Onygenales sp. PD_40]|nr:hypothetical protein FQN55_008733 [Onygenales sp. PD_40]KAK2770010.1 hypothetical protein FQN53_005785 [Emmonsiellopsis sp. PD_33]KAK2794752.1 hypothetical protein FQN52_007522 [Onygenales sp. PD_12]KAK2807110.1 hypothetical protein FQN51_004724 [Onygenales sp. PD_10]